MNISLLAVTAALILAPLSSSAAADACVAKAAPDACAPYAALLKTAWRLSYERTDGPSRLATLDKAECTTAMVTYPPYDMDPYDSTEYPEPRLRFWAAGSPYEIEVEISRGLASVALMKREGPYWNRMARIDEFPAGELATTTIDYNGDVNDREYPELRASRGVRRTVRAARVVLAPLGR